MRIQSVVLEHHRYVSVLRSDVVDALVIDEEFAFRDFFKAGDHSKSCTFAATRRSDENDEFLILDFETEIRNCGNSARISLVNVFKENTCHM